MGATYAVNEAVVGPARLISMKKTVKPAAVQAIPRTSSAATALGVGTVKGSKTAAMINSIGVAVRIIAAVECSGSVVANSREMRVAPVA